LLLEEVLPVVGLLQLWVRLLLVEVITTAARGAAAAGHGVSAAGQGAVGEDCGVSAAGRGQQLQVMVGVEVALDLHDNPLIPIRGLLITAARNALLYCSASKLCFPLAMINGSWFLNCMEINIPIAIKQLNQFVASSAPLLTSSLVVGILPFHLSFCRLNKLGKPLIAAFKPPLARLVKPYLIII
jgi:hypothetical protein